MYIPMYLPTNSGAYDPTIVGYNGSVVKIFNVMSSLAHFESKNVFIFILWKTL
jgi:hypothetical protein